MFKSRLRRMSQCEFLDWLQAQTRRHELVDGVPMMMAGANRRHDQIVINAIAALHTQLRGATCRPFSADTAVFIPAGNVRYPDVGVECGEFQDDARHASEPSIVIEVLSASTRDFDLFGKVEEYKTVTCLKHIVLVHPDEPRVLIWSRHDETTWHNEPREGLTAVIEFAIPEITLTLVDLYAGLEFRDKPKLVQ